MCAAFCIVDVGDGTLAIIEFVAANAARLF
jgi:hypothetical protein